MRLSVLIPAYNERDTIETVVAAVRAALPEIEKEIIIVDDRSTDGTDQRLRSLVHEGGENDRPPRSGLSSISAIEAKAPPSRPRWPWRPATSSSFRTPISNMIPRTGRACTT